MDIAKQIDMRDYDLFGDKVGLKLSSFLRILKMLSDGTHRDYTETIAEEGLEMEWNCFVLTKTGTLYLRTLWDETDGIAVKHPFPVLANMELVCKGVEISEDELFFCPFEIKKIIKEICKIVPTRRKHKECDDSYLDAGVYIIKGEITDLYKIGCSNNVYQRIKGLESANADIITTEKIIKTQNYYELESFLHSKFWSKRIKGEWFRLDKQDLEHIDEYVEIYRIYAEGERN